MYKAHYLRSLRLKLCVAWFASLAYCVSTPNTSLAQAPEASYPSSPRISATPLDSAKRSALEALINGKLAISEYAKLRSAICPHSISRSPVNHESMKNAITETKVDLATELLFERNAGASTNLLEKFSFVIDFSPTRVLIQHLSPRFEREAAGYSVPLPTDFSRGVRVEGTMGADILSMIPPIRECGLQAIVICPRQYEKIDRLVPAPYTLRGARTLVSGKADGVVASPTDAPTKVMAAIVGSDSVALPTEWFSQVIGPRTVTANKTLTHNRAQRESLPPFVPITSLPFTVAVESRVDIGTEATPLRSSSKRVNLEISKFTLVDKPELALGKSILSVQGGECYLVSEWTDEIV